MPPISLRAASVRRSVVIPLPEGDATFFSFQGLDDGKEHLAIGFGNWNEASNPLVRLHSECLTGDVFASTRCDCGDQLREARGRLAKEGGLLLYLRQEGRGIGLYNKLDAYDLQRHGLDTYQANRRLGLKDDCRNYEAAAQMLAALGVTSLRLLSNNPEKRDELLRLGITVTTMVSTGVYLNPANREYLRAKVSGKGHTLQLDDL